MNQYPEFEGELAKLKRYLAEKPKCLILPHANPDGDALGASLGLYTALAGRGIVVDIACLDACPESFRYLVGAGEIKQDFKPDDYQAIFFVDCGDKNLTQFHNQYPEILTDRFVKINIDHHPSNDGFGEINFVTTTHASASMIVYDVLQGLEYVVSPTVATALLTGIYTDTGCFMHQNTTPIAYRYAGELMNQGASNREIMQNVFQTYRYETLKLWGKVLKNLELTSEGAAIVGVAESDYQDLGCTRQDLTGVIDFINSMPQARYSVLLSEDGKGNVKASLRTRNDEIDVKALAEKFGGGGHVKASGFTIPGGRLEKEIKWKIVQE